MKPHSRDGKHLFSPTKLAPQSGQAGIPPSRNWRCLPHDGIALVQKMMLEAIAEEELLRLY